MKNCLDAVKASSTWNIVATDKKSRHRDPFAHARLQLVSSPKLDTLEIVKSYEFSLDAVVLDEDKTDSGKGYVDLFNLRTVAQVGTGKDTVEVHYRNCQRHYTFIYDDLYRTREDRHTQALPTRTVATTPIEEMAIPVVKGGVTYIGAVHIAATGVKILDRPKISLDLLTTPDLCP